MGSWAKNAIVYMNNKGLVNGYEDGSFKPSNNITRAEFYSIINKLAGYTQEEAISFSDVKESNWYYKTLRIAKKIRIYSI